MPSFKQEVFVFSDYSGHRRHGFRSANSFAKFLLSPFVIQTLKTNPWQRLLKRTPSATHPPGHSNGANVIPSIPGVQRDWHGHSCTTEHLCRTFPPAVGLLFWSISRLLSCSGDAGRIYSSWITYFLPSITSNPLTRRGSGEKLCLCVHSSLSKKEPCLKKGLSVLHSYCHTPKGRQYNCDILWLPSKIAGISLI